MEGFTKACASLTIRSNRSLRLLGLSKAALLTAPVRSVRPMSTILRAATIEDCTSIADLMTSVIFATVDKSYQVETIKNSIGNLEYWKENLDCCVHLVAEINSSIVGVILVKEFWNLCSLYVDVGHHRNGIGRALTEAAISACANRSPKDAIFLNSSPFSVNFYAALGFQPRETSQQLHPGVKPMRFNLAENKD